MFQKLANAMNAKAPTEDIIPDLHLSKWQLKQWFHGEKGKLYNICEKPHLTDEKREARVWYATRMIELIAQQKNITYLGEKWFYTTSQWKKLKFLSWQEFEAEGADRLLMSVMW